MSKPAVIYKKYSNINTAFQLQMVLIIVPHSACSYKVLRCCLPDERGIDCSNWPKLRNKMQKTHKILCLRRTTPMCVHVAIHNSQQF